MKYFGTDGIRGKFGDFPVNEFCVNILAQALEQFHSGLRRIIIGRDTRLSGEAIKNFLIAGFSSTVEIMEAGIITSPLLSRAVDDTKSDFGLMITASHNSSEDNGVKVFDHLGAKLSQENELKIESLMDEIPDVAKYTGHKIMGYRPKVHYVIDGKVFKNFPKVVIDCANGAAVTFAKESYHFQTIKWLGDCPNGQNINGHCGSEHPELLIQAVHETHADLGIAHDGDGDRLLLCDREGNILPGEIILGTIAIYLQEVGRLKERSIVTTLMSNEGLRISLKDYGIGVIDAEVGDRNVADRMRELGCNLGGESSGHILFLDEAPTSDGIQTALLFLRALSFLKLTPEYLSHLIKLLPKKSCNIPVSEKVPLENLHNLQQAIQKEREKVGQSGKIFIRYSGTEPKLRLLIEAETEPLVEDVMKNLKNSIARCKEFI
ncbi:MAG: hypothetical protein LBS71_01100 [Puniceicoccales bacterium]|jgi:phosphoglucosamine mutase|nr:hypothetical protein [Puniceicoccales bacterium]